MYLHVYAHLYISVYIYVYIFLNLISAGTKRNIDKYPYQTIRSAILVGLGGGLLITRFYISILFQVFIRMYYCCYWKKQLR